MVGVAREEQRPRAARIARQPQRIFDSVPHNGGESTGLVGQAERSARGPVFDDSVVVRFTVHQDDKAVVVGGSGGAGPLDCKYPMRKRRRRRVDERFVVGTPVRDTGRELLHLVSFGRRPAEVNNARNAAHEPSRS